VVAIRGADGDCAPFFSANTSAEATGRDGLDDFVTAFYTVETSPEQLSLSKKPMSGDATFGAQTSRNGVAARDEPSTFIPILLQNTCASPIRGFRPPRGVPARAMPLLIQGLQLEQADLDLQPRCSTLPVGETVDARCYFVVLGSPGFLA